MKGIAASYFKFCRRIWKFNSEKEWVPFSQNSQGFYQDCPYCGKRAWLNTESALSMIAKFGIRIVKK